MKQLTRNELFLIALTLFGAVIRFWNLDKDPFHTDEEFTFNLVQKPVLNIIWYGLTQDCNPPLFYLIDYISILLLGATRFAVRFPSVVAGTLLIPVSYFFGKELEDEYTGLFAAVVIATLGSMWYYSQFGRAYMLIALLFVLAALFFVRLLNGSGECDWIGFAIFTALCAYTHLYSIIPLVFMWSYLLWIRPNRTLLWASVVGICCLPLTMLGYSILTGRTSGAIMAVGNTIPQLILILPLEYFGYSFAIFFVLIGLAVWKYRDVRGVPVLVAIAVLTVTAQLAVSTVTPVFARYSLLLVPVVITVAMVPVSRFVRSDALPVQKWFAILVFFLVYLSTVIFQAVSEYYLPKG